MKRSIFVTVVIAIAIPAYGQESCKVLLPSLVGKYTGECRQGLANGKGEATGEDFYTGDFIKGLPDGRGKYIWKSGATYEGEWKRGLRNGNGIYISKVAGKDTVMNGLWKEDKFAGTKKMEPYIIEYRTGVGRVTCMRIGDRPYVKYKFSRSGAEANIISNLLMQGSSGTERNSSDFTGFEEARFPFSGKLTFTAPNNFHSAMINCEVRLTINEPGAWLVSISL